MSLGSPNRKRVPVVSTTVFPAQAGIQQTGGDWIPACAGMTGTGCRLDSRLRGNDGNGVATGFPPARE